MFGPVERAPSRTTDPAPASAAMELSDEYPIARYEKGRLTPAKDTIILEARVELVVNDGEMRLAMLCLPRELKELAAGFLRGEGALRRREDLHSAEFVEAESTIDVRGEFDPDVLDAIHRRWTWGTGCGGGGTSGRLDSSGYTAVGEGITVIIWVGYEVTYDDGACIALD